MKLVYTAAKPAVLGCLAQRKLDSGTGWRLSPIRQSRRTSALALTILTARIALRFVKTAEDIWGMFDDGPAEKGGKRYCINSVCLDSRKD